MLRCKQVTTMVANDDLADAGLWVRLQVRLHLWMCRHCAGYAAQMRQLGVKLREQFRHEDDMIDIKRLERQILDAARSDAARSADEQDSK